MSDFSLYFKLGIDHLLDPNGLDHVYFIISFVLLYGLRDWKRLLGLVTAFTLGHSLTLALASLDLVHVNSDLVETLIPITILISCIFNFYVLATKEQLSRSDFRFTYLVLTLFGLIHGLGFSNFLRSLLFEGESIFLPLLSFNIGIEVGQVIIVALVLIVLFVLDQLFGRQKALRLIVNSLVTMAVVGMLL